MSRHSAYKWSRVTFVLLTLCSFILPVLLLLLKSVTTGWRFPSFIPDEITFRAWKTVFQDPKIMESLITTAEIAVSVVILNLLIGIPAAKAISHHDFKGKTIIETILFMPILVPVLAVAMGLHLTMIKLGLADQIIGVILIHLLPTLPYSIRMLRAGYDRFGIKWEDQARSLGVSKLKVFWTIHIPMLLPSLRSTILLVFVISLSQYALTAIIGGGLVTTLPMLYYPFFSSADEGMMASFSVLFTLLPILFLFLFEIMMIVYLRLIKR